MAHPVTSAARSYTATVVAICPAERLDETMAAVRTLQSRAAVRPIVVTLGEAAEPQVAEDDGTTVIHGLRPRFLNNVVAARRLSSLPAVVWWRGGDRGVLDDVAPLVDRLILDSPAPVEDWRTIVPLLDNTAFSDLRWTRLTRWRNLMAQFFDLPSVRTSADTFAQLDIHAADPDAAALFAGWLAARLPGGRALRWAVHRESGPGPLSAVSLRGPAHTLELQITSSGTCVQASLDGGAIAQATRVVSLGDRSLAALLDAELRIRARDTSFEHALRSAVGAV